MYQGEQGFTLLEVVVAITIISLLAVVMAPFIGSSVSRIQWAGDRKESLAKQRGLMESQLAMEVVSREAQIPIQIEEIGFFEVIDGWIVETEDFITFMDTTDNE